MWYWCKNNQFPKPYKLSSRRTAWRAEEVREWIENKAKSEVQS
ncbi:MAG: AlpA family phage regulatory protein [Burkholderiales bacterium]|nr:AlpA family phage regulatory protein [Burkholderiales bacterium]